MMILTRAVTTIAHKIVAIPNAFPGGEAVKWLVEAYDVFSHFFEPFASCTTARACIERVMLMNALELIGLMILLGLIAGLVRVAVRACYSRDKE